MIRIGIVDDHAVIRSGLKAYFSTFVEFQVNGEASTGREAIDLVRTTDLDVLLLDLSMPGQSGIDALSMIRAKAPELGILVFSAYPEEHYALNMLRQGASGYLNKECQPEEIAQAVHMVASGRRYISSSVGELLLRHLNRKDDAPPHESLSNREFQVFMKLAKGEVISEIAETLSLSVKTISTYRSRLLEKLGLATNSDLTYYAMKSNILD